jgi:hypothetical protein
MKYPLDRIAADLTYRDGVVTHALQHLEGVAVFTAVLVDRQEAGGAAWSESSDTFAVCQMIQAVRWRPARNGNTGTSLRRDEFGSSCVCRWFKLLLIT